MKSIITLILVFFTSTLFAQSGVLLTDSVTSGDLPIYSVGSVGIGGPLFTKQSIHFFTQSPTPEVFTSKNDTLIVPVGKYKFIRIGDKVYKLKTELEEVHEGFAEPHSRILQIPNWGELNNYYPLGDTTTLWVTPNKFSR